jgi:hypothetical protein
MAPSIIVSRIGEGSLSQQTIDNLVPMKHAGRPEKVASLVGFLVFKLAGCIPGRIEDRALRIEI